MTNLPSQALFTARFATLNRANEYVQVGLADDQKTPSRYLLITRAFKFDDQDIALDFDRIHVELNDQLHSAYAEVVTVDLNDDQLLVNLDRKSATNFPGGSPLVIRLELPPPHLESLPAWLAEVLKL